MKSQENVPFPTEFFKSHKVKKKDILNQFMRSTLDLAAKYTINSFTRS